MTFTLVLGALLCISIFGIVREQKRILRREIEHRLKKLGEEYHARPESRR